MATLLVSKPCSFRLVLPSTLVLRVGLSSPFGVISSWLFLTVILLYLPALVSAIALVELISFNVLGWLEAAKIIRANSTIRAIKPAFLALRLFLGEGLRLVFRVGLSIGINYSTWGKLV